MGGPEGEAITSGRPMIVHSTIDLFLFHLINGLAGDPVRDSIIWHLDQNNVPRELVLISPYIFFWFSEKSAAARAKLVTGLFGAFLAILAARLVAHFAPFETRPMYDPASGFHRLATAHVLDMENWSAFPSDTAAFSVALTLGLFPIQRAASVVLTGAAMLLFGVSRIYLGIHYPVDVVAGWLIGGGAAALASLPVMQIIGRASQRLEAVSAPLFYACSAVVLAEIGQMFDNVRGVMRVFHLLA